MVCHQHETKDINIIAAKNEAKKPAKKITENRQECLNIIWTKTKAKIYLISSASTISRRQVIDKISGDIKNWN